MLADRMRMAAGGSKKRYTKSLLHFTDTVNILVDSAGKIWTMSGTIVTHSGKFGAGIDITNPGYIGTSASNLILGNKDFTIEFWAYNPLSFGQPSIPICTMGVGTDVTKQSLRIGADVNRRITASVYIGGVEYALASTVGIQGQTWTHFELTRSGGSLYLFRSGILAASRADLGALAIDNIAAGTLRIGNGYSAYFDEVRVSIGIARHTEAFTPATEEYSMD